MRYCALGVGDDLAAGWRRLAREERHFVEGPAVTLMFGAAATTLRLADGLRQGFHGAVSGADELVPPTRLMATATSCASRRSALAQTRRMIWSEPGDPPGLAPHKARLLQRKVTRFDESNWRMGPCTTAVMQPRCM